MSMEAYLNSIIGLPMPLVGPNHELMGLLESLCSTIPVQKNGEFLSEQCIDPQKISNSNSNSISRDVNSADLNNFSNCGNPSMNRRGNFKTEPCPKQDCKRKQPQSKLVSLSTGNGIACKRPKVETDQEDIVDEKCDQRRQRDLDIELRTLMQQQIVHPRQVSSFQSLDGGICSRRLMQYLYHLQHRPNDNNIAYWRKFVGEYYAPCAKKRWCFSMYENIGQQAFGVFSQAAMEAWHCDICGSKSGKGFEAVFDILPRLKKIKFESGVLDELLFLDLPRERRFPSGLMMLEYGKAVQKSAYEEFHVVHEGKLRIVFRQDLKMLSWEFCVRHHDELLLRRLIVPQVNQLIQAAREHHHTNTKRGSNGVSLEEARLNCNMLLRAGHQLARNLELPLVNDLGFSKRFVRCLQIAEVVDSMKDLMNFSLHQNVGPMESLDTCPRKGSTTNTQTKEMEIEQNVKNDGEVFSSSQGELEMAFANYYQKLLKENSTKSASTSASPGQDHNQQQQQMIDKLLQEMVANSRANKNRFYEVGGNAASVSKSDSSRFGTNVVIKREPDLHEFEEQFENGVLGRAWMDVSYKWKA